jgi:hypothetical protein
MRNLLLWMLALTVAGCATGRLSDAERLALYRAHAGAPVRDFSYTRSLNGWTALGDSALAVWTRPNQAYLLELFGPCSDLQYAPTILISNQFDRVSAGFDRVSAIGGTGGIRVACRIQTIRPLQVKALRASERQLREARLAEREGAAQ